MVNCVYFFLFLALPRWAASSEKLTLHVAVKQALQESSTLKKAQALYEQAGWKKAEAFGSGFLPRMGFSAQHFFKKKYVFSTMNFSGMNMSFPGMYPRDQFSVDFTMPIFNGFANIKHYQAASSMQAALENEWKQAEFELTQDVRMAFYRALAALDLKKVAYQNVTTLEDHLNQVKVQKAGGVATHYDELRIQVQLSEARSDAMDADDNVELSREKLNELIGIHKDDREMEGFLPVPEDSVLKKVKKLTYSQGEQKRLDLRALSLKTQSAHTLSQAQSLWFVPSINLAGQYMLYNAQIYQGIVINTGNFQPAYNLGVFLRWNLFDGGVSYSVAQQTHYGGVALEKSLQLLQMRAPYDFAYWKRKWISSVERYHWKQLSIRQSEESVRLAREEQKLGSRTSTEVLDAELDLIRARAGSVNAQLSSAEAQVRLELALGRMLDEFI